MKILLSVAALMLLIECYAFRAIKTAFPQKPIIMVYMILSALSFAYILWQMSQFDRKVGQNKAWLMATGLFLMLYVPKLLICLGLLVEDLGRGFGFLYQYFIQNKSGADSQLARRAFISKSLLALAAVPFLSIIYGISKGKYNFKIIQQKLKFNTLPKAFDGLRILQISDIHSGSLDNVAAVQKAIDMINAQACDLILFTGDIVNNHAQEMAPWIDIFKQIKTPKYGKFSVLGNHDYGEYLEWISPQEKAQNFEDIKALHAQIGFKLLLNQQISLEENGEKIHILGVENWGLKFKQAGDLTKTIGDLQADDFKILMSHDPSHWNHEVQHQQQNVQLTLSGHTHGLQFGIEIPGFIKWSPVKYMYPQWAGLYHNQGRYLYVNRGFGFHAYPGRVGIWPEITIIELQKA
jgi:uncharacterized protein